MRGEQLVRAQALADLANVWVVDERAEDLDSDVLLAVRAALGCGLTERALPFRTDGAAAAAAQLKSLADPTADHGFPPRGAHARVQTLATGVGLREAANPSMSVGESLATGAAA